MQEAFLRVVRARTRYEPTARFTTWLFRIVYNLAVNETQRNSPRASCARSDPRIVATRRAARRTSAEIGDAEAEKPSEALEREDRVRAVRAAIARLPETQRMALILANHEERPYAEIAEILGSSEKAVKSLVHRAREDLRELLAPYSSPRSVKSDCTAFRPRSKPSSSGRPSHGKLAWLSWHEHLLSCRDCRELLEKEEALEALLAMRCPSRDSPTRSRIRVLARLRRRARRRRSSKGSSTRSRRRSARPAGLAAGVLARVAAERGDDLDALLDLDREVVVPKASPDACSRASHANAGLPAGSGGSTPRPPVWRSSCSAGSSGRARGSRRLRRRSSSRAEKRRLIRRSSLARRRRAVGSACRTTSTS